MERHNLDKDFGEILFLYWKIAMTSENAATF